MMDSMVTFPWQMAGGFLTLLTITLALYLFLQNPHMQMNRLVSIATGLIAVTNVGSMLAIQANTYAEGMPALTIIAATIPAIGPVLLMATIGMFKPNWIRGWLMVLWLLLVFMTLLPIGLTIIDRIAGSNIYLALPDPESYSGGYLKPEQIVNGILGQVIIQANLVYWKVILIGLFMYLIFSGKSQNVKVRNLFNILLGSLIVGWFIEIFLEGIIPNGMAKLISGALISISYVYVALRYIAINHSLPTGRVQTRLTILIATIAIPLIVFISWFLLGQAQHLLEQKSQTVLKNQTVSISSTVDQVIRGYISALENLASQPDIQSMDPVQQKPVLESMADVYTSIYLVSTTNLSGLNVARSDNNDLVDYSDRLWYQEVINGADFYLQSLIGRSTGKPALVVSVPILDDVGQIVGVCMLSGLLTEISAQVITEDLGETGYAYVVDNQDQLVAHPNLIPGSTELVNYGAVEPVMALREDKNPPLIYRDVSGIEWLAYYQDNDLGWGVVVQQQIKEINKSVTVLQKITTAIALIGSLLLLGLVVVTIRQIMRPINSLTETVIGIASGDLSRLTPVESNDEFGTLAQAFNSMTLQIRNLIDGLERRVAERTLDLEHRSALLQAAAEVGHASANIRNLDELLPLVTRLVSERFGFYHVGIYLLDVNQEYLFLRAANSEGGLRMVSRGHKLLIGQEGIVGYVSQYRQPRIVSKEGEDTVFFNNPDLPQAQSEIALPLIVGAELFGVLDVQSVERSAFTDQDIHILQVLTDQVAIALHSARLVQQIEQVLNDERRLYGEISHQAWRDQIRGLTFKGFSRTQGGLIPIREIKDAKVRQTIHAGNPVIDPDNAAVLYTPVKVRGAVLGVLKLTRTEQGSRWTNEDLELTETLAEQLGVSLESARAYQTTQISAQKDRVLAEIGSRIRESLDVDLILRIASQEVRRALGIPKVIIQLGMPENVGNPSQNHIQSVELQGNDPLGQPAGDEAGIPNQRGSHE